MPASLTDDQFATVWAAERGSPARVAEVTGMAERAVYKRRDAMAARGVVLNTGDHRPGQMGSPVRHWAPLAMNPPRRHKIEVRDGVVIVFSDAHYWPNLVSVSHKALLVLVKRLKPAVVIANGDVLDGARISRHDRNGWERRPTLKKELDACQERMAEIAKAAGKAALVWNLGNHDMRFENYLARNAPEAEGIPGTTLPEHFPAWTFAISTVINPNADHPVMVKHRHHNGVHAAYNNTLKGGISIVTGHLHRLLVTSWGDYRGRRYGVDTGTLASPYGPQFAYTEDAPTPAGEGFAVLTFREGRLQPPELVEVVDDEAIFRGEVVRT